MCHKLHLQTSSISEQKSSMQATFCKFDSFLFNNCLKRVCLFNSKVYAKTQVRLGNNVLSLYL